MKKKLNVTALVIALNEQHFIKPCLSSLYPFVNRLYVVTNYDTDYYLNYVEPDLTVNFVKDFDDPEKKIVLLLNRKILDETIQRNWAMASDQMLYKTSQRKIYPHAHTIEIIRSQNIKTDYYWVVDADEIYDPETIPPVLDYVRQSNRDAILVRGHNFFKKWNYRISLKNDQFWQIGFIRSGLFFYNRRHLYIPRPFGWLWHINPLLYEKIANMYCHQVKLPESIANFYHGSYVGDDTRIHKKLRSSSHAKELQKTGLDEWFTNVWEPWTPDSRNFYFFDNNPEVWESVDHISTSNLPSVIRDYEWPLGWIER